MQLIQSKKSVWLSGEICEVSGAYFSDTCGHKVEREFTANDIFTRCSTCHRPIRWVRFSRNPIDTQKTLSFSKRAEFNFPKPGSSNKPG